MLIDVFKYLSTIKSARRTEKNRANTTISHESSTEVYRSGAEQAAIQSQLQSDQHRLTGTTTAAPGSHRCIG